MSKLNEEQRQEIVRSTYDAAMSLKEDLTYLEAALKAEPPKPDDVRRMSAILRRILVERDLAIVAAPRVGAIILQAIDLQPFYVFSRKHPFHHFYSGGANIFGFELFAVAAASDGAQMAEPFDHHRRFSANLETFLRQNVICLEGKWITRRDVIKYIANVAQGVHSGNMRSEADTIIQRVRKMLSLSVTEAHVHLTIKTMNTPEPDLVLDRSSIDCALIEILSTIRFVLESEDVKRLRLILDEES